MGLDVSVYKNISITESEDYDFIAYVIDKSWEYKIKNLEIDCRYIGDKLKESIRYSYSSHNRFRENLLRLVNRDDLIVNDKIYWDKLEIEINIPFYDLINFADNEGCLDWETNLKIYNDFVKWMDKADKFMVNSFFPETYKSWMNVFKVGKEKNSVVVFH